MSIFDVNTTLRTAFLRAAYAEMQEEEREIFRNRKFYAGEQGIALTARQREYLGDFWTDITDESLCNVCKRVVNIPLERLAVASINSDGAGASTFADEVNRWWKIGQSAYKSRGKRGVKSSQLGSWQYDIYEASLRDSVSCLIVGWDTDHPTFTLNEIYDGTDGSIRLHYSEDDATLLFASKRWHPYDMTKLAPSARTRLTVYLPDSVIRFEDDANAPDGWRQLTEQEAGFPNPQPWVDVTGQPLGIPVIAFWNPGGSELDDAIMPQKAMNKSLADLLASQDMHGFPLLALKGYKTIPGADGKPSQVKISPGEAITMPTDGDAIRIPGADLAPMFNTGVLGWLQLISIIKGWPLYLLMNGQPPSGVALKVMESSLVAQVVRKQEGFADSWMEAFDMGARLYTAMGRGVLTGGIKIEWKDPETEDPLAKYQALTAKFDTGQIPIPQRWRELGYTDEQIADMQAEQVGQAAEAARQSIMAALFAQRQMPQLGGDANVMPMLGSGIAGNG
jgi:hypothetical protein